MGKARHAGVWLVRAGPTTWDDEGRLCGAADLPLSKAGGSAAAERARALAGQALSVVLCGPDEASRVTAEQISAACGVAAKPNPELRDIGLGLWEGVREADLEGRCKTTYRQWKSDPASVSVPGGELFDTARDRMVAAVRKLVPKHASGSSTMCVVLRPMALGLVRCWLEARPTTDLWALGTEGPGVERYTVDCERLREKLGLATVLGLTGSKAAAKATR